MPEIVGAIFDLVNRLAIFDYRLALHDDRFSQASRFASYVEATSLPVSSRLPLPGIRREDEIMVILGRVIFGVVTDHVQGFWTEFDKAATGRRFSYGNLFPLPSIARST